MTGRSVYIHVVTYNSSESILKCIDGAVNQKDYTPGENLILHISDNASSDNTSSLIEGKISAGIKLICNPANYGFCAAHNIAIRNFLDSGYSYFLCLNPDLFLEADAISRMISAIESEPDTGTACPKLLRSDFSLKPLDPPVIDAAGMYITYGLRHFDRGSNMPDATEFSRKAFVFGGSGACLLMKKEYIGDVALNQPEYRKDIEKVYPQLKSAHTDRMEVFDEAFFAYREDADLAWRSQLLGWKCLYVPDAIGYHVRRVTPEKRDILPQEINLLGVKNRFLLQLNNYSLAYGLRVFLEGYFIRNIIVITAVVLKERTSLAAINQLLKLFRRALDRRRILKSKIKIPHKIVASWFHNRAVDC